MTGGAVILYLYLVFFSFFFLLFSFKTNFCIYSLCVFSSVMSSSIDYSVSSYANDPSSADPLQSVAVYKHSSVSEFPSNLWLIFLHGGAWRDPRNDHHNGDKLLSTLINKFPTKVSGASIDYRLSKPLDGPQKGAMHPDFTIDALSALLYLNSKYKIDNFVLIGHSAGAFISLQCFINPSILLSSSPSSLSDIDTSKIPPLMSKCLAVFGIAGIYSLPLLITEEPSYSSFLDPAFGPDQSKWESASVVPYTNSNSAPNLFPSSNFKLVAIYSPEDELLNSKYQPSKVVELYTPILGKEESISLEVTDGHHEDTYTSPTTASVIEKYISSWI